MSKVEVDGAEREVSTLTSEQVFYLLQCRPVRLTLAQLGEWRDAERAEAYSDGQNSMQ